MDDAELVQHALKAQEVHYTPAAVMRPLSAAVSWDQLKSHDWAQQELQELYAIQSVLNKQVSREPSGTRSIQLPADDHVRSLYPDWEVPFKAGLLFKNANVWHEVFSEFDEPVPQKLNKWLTEGYSVYIDKDAVDQQPGRNRLSQAESAFISRTIEQDWVPMGMVQPIRADEVHHQAVVCNLLVAYRNGQMDRVVWSGKPVNDGVDDASFKMEQLQHIMAMAQPGDVAFSLDFEKGFYQFGLKRGLSHLLVFMHNGKYYRWLVLPMGLKSAPRDFSWVVKRILRLFRKRGIRCAFFIDDLIFLARSYDELYKIRKFVLDTLYRLGFRVSLRKSLLSGGDLIRHLGFDLCFADCSLWIPTDKIMVLKAACADLLGRSGPTGSITGREVAQIVGRIQSFRLACPPAYILSKGLSRCLATLPFTRRGSFLARDFDERIVLSDLAVAELRLWCECIFKMRCCKLHRKLESLIFLDGSTSGCGYVATEVLNTAAKRAFNVSDLAAGQWESKCDAHSTTFELYTMLLTLQNEAERLAGKRVHVCTDNVGSAFIASKGCAKNRQLHAWAMAIWQLCLQWDIKLSMQYLAGDGIIVSGADGLSRGSDPYNCTLSVSAFQRLWQWKGPFEVDTFAAPGAVAMHPGTKVALDCVSPFVMPKRLHSDALSFVSERTLYAFPPPGLIHNYLHLVNTHSMRCVLIVPEWTTSIWWPLVSSLPTFRLGPVKSCVKKGESGLAHPFGRSFSLEQALDTELLAVAINM